MVLKSHFFKVYYKFPIVLRIAVFSLFSFMMRFLNPIIVLKMKEGKFLNRPINEIENIEEAISFVLNFRYLFFSIKIGQKVSEITNLLEILQEAKPKLVLEIGTAGGGTLFLFTRVADVRATIISLDLPGGQYGGGYSQWKIPIYKSFARCFQKVELLRANSHNKESLELVKEILGKKSVDFLFIDGDHSYEGVKKDFEMYSPLVRKGGIIAFHDIADFNNPSKTEVYRLWKEIRGNYRYREFVESRDQNWAGIGVILKQNLKS